MRTLQKLCRTFCAVAVVALASHATEARGQAVISAELETTGDLVPGAVFDVLFSITSNDTGQVANGADFELVFDPASVSLLSQSTVSYPTSGTPANQSFSVFRGPLREEGALRYYRYNLVNVQNPESTHPLMRAQFQLQGTPDSPFSIDFRPSTGTDGTRVLLDTVNDPIPFTLDLDEITGLEVVETDFALVSTTLPGGPDSIVAGGFFDVGLTLDSINVPDAGGVELAITYDTKSVQLVSAGSGDLGALTLGPAVPLSGSLVSRTVTAENAANDEANIDLGLLSFYVTVPTAEPFDILVGPSGGGPAVVETDLTTAITAAFNSEATRGLTAENDGFATIATSLGNADGSLYEIGTNFEVPVRVVSNSTGEAPVDAYFSVTYDSDIVSLAGATALNGFGTLTLGGTETVSGSIVSQDVSITGGSNENLTVGLAVLEFEVQDVATEPYSIVLGPSPNFGSVLENDASDSIPTAFNNNATLNFPFDGDNPDAAVVQTVIASGNPNARDSEFDVLVRVANNPTGIVPAQASIVLTYDTASVEFLGAGGVDVGGVLAADPVVASGSTVNHRISTIGGTSDTGSLTPGLILASFRTVADPVSPYDIIVSGDGSTPLLGEADGQSVPVIAAVFNSDQTTGLGPEGCFFLNVEPESINVASTATGTEFSVLTSGETCQWSVVSNDAFITIVSDADGEGTGTVEILIAENIGAARTGTVTVTGETADGPVAAVFTVNQEAGCVLVLDPSGVSAPAEGGDFSFAIELNDQDCDWTAESNDAFITITSATSGTGDSIVELTVAATDADFERVGTVTVNDQVFTVTQAGRCTFSVEPDSFSFPVVGGSGSVAVATNEGDCGWTAVANDPFITITSGESGEGAGTVEFSVAANDGAERTGTITIGTETVTISQDAGCNVTISPTSASFAAAGGSGDFDIVTVEGCAWTVVSNVAWVTIDSDESGEGPATVTFNVEENEETASRIGTLVVNNRTFTVFQSGTDADGEAVIAGNVTGGNPDLPNSEFTVLLSVIANDSGLIPDAASVSVTFDSSSVELLEVEEADLGAIVAGDPIEDTESTLIVRNFVAVGGSNASNLPTPAIATLTFRTIDAPLAPYSILFDDSTIENSTTLIAQAPGFESIPAVFFNEGTENLGGDACFFLEISDSSASFTEEGGDASFDILTSGANCEWSVASNDAFITITSGTSGSGNGTVSFSVAANTGVERTGTITVTGNTIQGPVTLTFTVEQEQGCELDVAPTSFDVAAGASSVTVNIDSSGASCPWTAVSNNAFLTIDGAASGTGSAEVTINVAANTGPARVGTLLIGGVGITVNQADGCTFSINPTSASIAAAGATSSFELTASNSECPWSVASNDAFITITSPISGTGSATIAFVVAENSTPQSRTGTITVAGQTFTVNQEAGCPIELSPATANFDADGGNGSITVTTPAGCPWSASASESWVVLSTTSGTGNGTVSYSVASNDGPQRTATVTVGNQTHTITQADGCSLELSAANLNIPAEGGEFSFDIVASASACPWSVSVDGDGVSITSASSGTGNALVTFTVAENEASSPRSIVFTVNGESITFSQAAACQITVSPLAFTVPAAGDELVIEITAETEDCAWSIDSSVAWLTFSELSGEGSASVTVTAAANDGNDREGSVTIAGQTVTFSQESGCGFTLSPTSESFDPGAGSGEFTVTASDEDCTWTAVASADWITIESPTESTTGDGTVVYSILANDGLPRVGTITVGSAVFTISQEGELENIYGSILDAPFVVGFSDLNNGIGDSVFLNVPGAIEGEIATMDRNGNMTSLTPNLSVGSNGRITGFMELAVTDEQGNTISVQEVPAAGRIVYRSRTNERITPLPDDELNVFTDMAVSNNIAVNGVFRAPGANWSFNLRGAERFSMTAVNGEVAIQSGLIGFDSRLSTGAAGNLARGNSQVLIRGWMPELGEIAFSRGVATPNPNRTLWTADAPVLLYEDGAIDQVIPGGTTQVRTRFFNVQRGVPGRYNLRAINSIYRLQSAGFLVTTEAETAQPDFDLDQLEIFPVNQSFTTPAAQNRVRTEWDQTLIRRSID